MLIHFVGGGPGAADLLTVRATRLLAAADVVLYPGTYLDPEVLAHCGPAAELVDTQGLTLAEMVEVMVTAARSHRTVVRLTSGDPSLYSALSEQTRRLAEAGVAWQVTPGVPAYAAAAARVGAELTVPLVAQSVVLTRTQRRSTVMPSTETLAAFAATRATLVLHLAITRIGDLMDQLAPEYGADCPVVVVYRASQPEELVLRSTVADIAQQVTAAGLRQAAVVLVGWALADVTRTGAGAGESFLYSAGRERGVRAAPGRPVPPDPAAGQG